MMTLVVYTVVFMCVKRQLITMTCFSFNCIVLYFIVLYSIVWYNTVGLLIIYVTHYDKLLFVTGVLSGYHHLYHHHHHCHNHHRHTRHHYCHHHRYHHQHITMYAGKLDDNDNLIPTVITVDPFVFRRRTSISNTNLSYKKQWVHLLRCCYQWGWWRGGGELW